MLRIPLSKITGCKDIKISNVKRKNKTLIYKRNPKTLNDLMTDDLMTGSPPPAGQQRERLAGVA